MKSVFSFTNYREFLNYYVSREGALRGLRTELAKAMGCQAAYLTQVLSDNAELTEDHTFRLVRHLNFTDFESDYLMLLVRLSRASSHELKAHLQTEAAAIARKSLDLQNRVKSKRMDENEDFAREYYSSWIPATVHILSSAEKYQTVEKMAKRLGITEAQVIATLELLESQELVAKKDKGRWVFAGAPLHLPRLSSLNTNQQIHQRLQVIKALQQGKRDDIHFSSTFTLDKETYETVKKMLSEVIESSHKKIHAGGTDELYMMCMDLFEVV